MNSPTLAINFCGIPCENPFFLACSPTRTGYAEIASALEEGWAGVFLKDNLETLRQLKQDYPSKGIIASVQGKEQLSDMAKKAEDMGADAVELQCSHIDAVSITEQIKSRVKIPVILKTTANTANLNILAINLSRAKANAMSLVLGPKNMSHFAFRRITEIASNPITQHLHLSAAAPVEFWLDGLELIELGCSNMQVDPSTMKEGPGIIKELISGFQNYMSSNNFIDLASLVGKKSDALRRMRAQAGALGSSKD